VIKVLNTIKNMLNASQFNLQILVELGNTMTLNLVHVRIVNQAVSIVLLTINAHNVMLTIKKQPFHSPILNNAKSVNLITVTTALLVQALFQLALHAKSVIR